MTVIGRRSAVAGDEYRRGARWLGGGFPGPESGDRPEETLAVPQRHADLFEVGFDQVAQDARVDLMLAEHALRIVRGRSRSATGRRSSSFPHTVRF